MVLSRILQMDFGEEVFYEVRGINLTRVAPVLCLSGWGRDTF